MFKKILAPVDGSIGSQAAAKKAMQIAADYGAEVTFIYVAVDIYSSSRLSNEDYSQLQAAYMAQGEAMLEDVINEVKIDGVMTNKKMLTGHPAQILLNECKEGGYDLVVIGSRGQSLLQDFPMGSVSSRVVQYAPCTVLIVR